MQLDPTFVYGNYVEAGVWATMGLVALVKRPNWQAVAIGVTLLFFGGSDVVEAHTGAWYDPWWLFAWKAVCVLLIVAIGLPLIGKKKRAQAVAGPTESR
ncbi:MAG: hypothetical protein QM754_20595 [Tepidisphaeraceae bacterium]